MEENKQPISLSVIVPCYNVEAYLDRSLGCLERQWNGRTDYEIILINDASTDKTIDKLNEFRKHYPNNVTVIDKTENAGAAEARNSGLDVARGEWIVFFDPDDALIDNSYCGLLEKADEKKIDIISFGAQIIEEKDWSDRLTQAEQLDFTITWIGLSQDYLLNNHFGTCFRFLFRRDLLLNHRFNSLSFLEDVVFVLPLFLSDLNVAIIEKDIYLYILRQSSATNMIDAKRLNRGCDDILIAIQFMNQCKQGKSDAVQARITGRQHFYVNNLFSRLLLSDKEINEIKTFRQALNEMSLLPFDGNGLKIALYNYLFKHLHVMEIFRPLYRLIRTLRGKLIH